MKIKIVLISIVALLFTSCETKKNLITSLSTKGNGLNCKTIYLTSDDEKVNRNTFIYGNEFDVNFDNIDGFTKEKNSAFPGLELIVTNKKGDTIMYNKDLYAKAVKGFDMSPLLLKTSITVANPMMSNNTYTMYVNIWDKKGAGTYSAEMDFDIVPNKKIKVKSNAISYNEIYLFSDENKTTIIDNDVKLNKKIYLLFEGLEGFIEENGKALIGLSIIAKDSKGKLLLSEKDLAGDAGMETSELTKQVAPFFIFSDTNYTNPVTCEVTIWDKRSENKIKAKLDLTLN